MVFSFKIIWQQQFVVVFFANQKGLLKLKGDTFLCRTMFSEENKKLLLKIGLTTSQVTVYSALLELDETNAKTLIKKAKLPSAVIYRTISELQKKGLVEKILATPYTFKATPLNLGLQILMVQQVHKCKELQREVKKFLLSNQSCLLNRPSEIEYKIRIVEGKEKILKTMKNEHNTVQRSVYILSTLTRFLQIIDCCFEEYEQALERNVTYQIIIADHKVEYSFQEFIQSLMVKPNFQLFFCSVPLICNLAVFDEQEATINYFPSKSLTESPIILTNHPSLIRMCIDHFRTVLKSTRKFKPRKNKKLIVKS